MRLGLKYRADARELGALNFWARYRAVGDGPHGGYTLAGLFFEDDDVLVGDVGH